MAEMLIQSESLTSIADKIRVLSGTSSAMGLDAMATHVNTANSNVSTEADLIAQIQSALEGKAAGGGSGGGSVETCTVTVNCPISDNNIIATRYVDSGVVGYTDVSAKNYTIEDVVANSMVFVLFPASVSIYSCSVTGDATYYAYNYMHGGSGIFYLFLIYGTSDVTIDIVSGGNW